jgi:general secretion pathway protein M
MNTLPRGVPGRVLAVAIGVVLLGIAYIAVVTPLLDFYDGRQLLLQERLELIGRLEHAAHDLPNLRQAAAKDEAEGHAQLLSADSSDAVLAAGLQATIKTLVTANGASVNSAEILAPLSQDAYRRVGLHITFSGNTDTLVAVLHGIESATPRLFVDNLEIRSAAASQGREAVAGGLAITFDVYGFRAS